MWLALAWAVGLPVLALAAGALEVRRDAFLLIVYAQAVVYVHVAPTLAAADVNSATQSTYASLQWYALGCFELPFLVIYAWTRARFARRSAGGPPREFVMSPVRTVLFCAVVLSFALGYYIVAVREGLVYRRLGEGIAELQLNMDFTDLLFYRTFMELGPYFMCILLLVVRVRPRGGDAVRLASGALVATAIMYFGYALINSRLTAVITLAALVGIYQLTGDLTRRLKPATVVGIALSVFAAAYMVRVVENVRSSFARGGSLFDPANLLPGGSGEAAQDDSMRWRLNGLDLIATISGNVASQGPALGTAWAAPLVVSLDPIVRTALTVEMKRAALTTSKSLLLLRYAGVSRTDYYSCMLSDAYGNFAVAGFGLVALVMGTLLAWATATVAGGASPAKLFVAAFVLTRLLPFEQEFASVLFGWFKLAPFVVLCCLVNPLRRRTRVPVSAVVAVG